MLDANKNKGQLQPYLSNPNVRWFNVDTAALKTMPFEAHEEERYGLRAGDIVICEGGEAGRAAIWDGRIPGMKFQKAIHRVRPTERLDARFFVHQLSADFQRGRLADYYTGATIKHLTRQDLARYRFSLPPLDYQRRIAAILDQADALRAKRREALAQLDSLTQSIFIEMFGDPVTNPRGFSRKSLGELIRFEGGSQPPASTFSFEETPETIRLVQIRDFKSDRFKTFIPRKLSRRFFEKDDVMIGRYGPPVFQILRGLSGSYNVALMKAVPREGVAKDFVFHLLQENRLHSFVVANSERTAGQSGVNLELLEKYDAYLPPHELQSKFIQRISVVDAMSASMRASLVELDTLFASIQHRAFAGQL